MAGSYLEDRLTSTIKAHGEVALRPRATFGQKIDKANRLGIFDDKATEILQVIREIRNEFAHSLANISFDSPNIVKCCNQLFAIESIRELRSSYVTVFKDSPAMLEMNSVLLDPILALPNNPRNTYMNTVKIMLFFMELSKASATMGDSDTLQIIRG
jgi:hypothetical protein